MKRTLTLRTERLAELTNDELTGVVGGANTKSCPDYTYYCATGYAICGDLPGYSRVYC
ncbi:MAG TPA: hypothetical protein VNA20_05685 [Frankiaceae bacterium]|nr:hypothetical protein [Frankiaceae bacterium]